MTFADFAHELNHRSAILASLATIFISVGFVRLALKEKGLIRHLATGLLLMHMVVFLRTFYWDVVQYFTGTVAWEEWSELTGGRAVNVIFNAMVVLAAYHSLRALKLAIPEDVRSEYSLIGAAFYPRPGFGKRLRKLRRSRSARK